MSEKNNILVVAGESSGDMHAAKVVRELKRLNPELNFWGTGGSELRAEGMDILCDIHSLDVVGFTEVIRRYGFFRKLLHRISKEARERSPRVAILVDYPGFNLRLARKLKDAGIKVLYYICPQVWAWNRGRVPKMANLIDRLMAIFPFESEVFASTDLKVDFVGHPLVNELDELRSLPESELPWRKAKRVALLPGSRAQEIKSILPIMLRTAARLESKSEKVSFLVVVPSRQKELAGEVIEAVSERPQGIELVVDVAREVLKQADASLVTSGTATLESVALRCPTLIVYKTDLLSYLIGRLLIRVPHLGIANIVAGREICPEFIQWDARPDKLLPALEELLDKSEMRTRMLDDYEEILNELGADNVAENVAQIVLEELA